MAQRKKQLHLNAFLMSVGHHEVSWRLPESDAFANTSIEHYTNLARIAERGKLDSLFLADSPMLWNSIGRRPSGSLEPTLLLTVLAGATQHIGLIATASTTYNEPYNLACRFASLDHISGGRAGWNIVTTAGIEAARNFNLEELPSHGERYARSAEFVDVSLKLWDSWDDAAPLGDKASGIWGDSSKVYPPRHVGRYFKVEGALDIPRSPQAYPLLVQAGSSEDGKGLAARYAEAVFTAQQTLEDAQAFHADQLIGRLGGGRGHRTFAGTPEQVADAMLHWWENGAADGFNVMPPVLPSGLTAFVDHVVPLLQRRGVFRTEYEGKTLREHYGLARPPNANLSELALRAAG